ncbi:Inactivated superfamily I helicase [Shimia thalassica]|uniref:Inactivated superfamily I helicase n=1 Tax=Shimia thalassica TaxID=1715693 RepID=A0A0P1ICF3_9RHOB|nr:PD-(D/E)XK nuclease family protein [Shimia thalassica]CUJ83649.1 Inactivated superfamily I helicase [Shimia thalassica]
MTFEWSNFQTQHPLTGAWRTLTPDLLAEAYLVPKRCEPDWDRALSKPDAPWAASYAKIPEQVRPVVESAYQTLLSATHDADLENLNLGKLPPSRARSHIEALRQIGTDLGTLPSGFSTVRHILSGGTSLETFPMCPPPPDGFATPLECALHKTLSERFGTAPSRPLVEALATPGTALRHIQDNLTLSTSPAIQDLTTRFLTVRDRASEADLAAAMVRRLLDDNVSLQDISLLVPDASYPTMFLQTSFEANGIPISGQTEAASRDLETEALWLLVQAAQPAPPPMVLASLCISPLMPWSVSEGRKFARSIIEYGGKTAPESLKTVIGQRPASYRSLLARLSGFFDVAPALDGAKKRLGALCNSKRNTNFDIEDLLRDLKPHPSPQSNAQRMVEAVNIWFGDREPRKPTRHLIVLGFSGASYPANVGTSPFFLDSELRLIEETTGLRILTRSERLHRNLARFLRHLRTTSDNVLFVMPQRDLDGKKRPQAPAFSLLKRALVPASNGSLETRLGTVPLEAWPCRASLSDPKPAQPVALPKDGLLHMGRDVLRTRKDDNGVMKRQSPSRLETMLVSPLVWVMNEAGASQVDWSPSKMDVLVQGSLFHAVLELCFPAGEPIPDESAIRARFDESFDKAMLREAPFLQEPTWKVEAASHRADALKIVLHWRERLESLKANILANEQFLEGSALGLRLNGFADSLIELSDKQVMVVDFKASKSDGRRERMEKGWDLQVALYQHMIAGAENEATQQLNDRQTDLAMAYHLLRDGVTLSHGVASPVPGLEAVDADISIKALEKLTHTIAQLGGGTIQLSRVSDAETFKKESGIEPYALKDNSVALALSLIDEGED